MFLYNGAVGMAFCLEEEEWNAAMADGEHGGSGLSFAKPMHYMGERRGAKKGAAIATPCWSLFSDEHLRPMVAGSLKSYANMSKLPVQNVGAMARTVHPRRHDFLRRALTLGDVFSGRSVRDAKVPHHVKRRAVSWACM
jgi:hypothetical protein